MGRRHPSHQMADGLRVCRSRRILSLGRRAGDGWRQGGGARVARTRRRRGLLSGISICQLSQPGSHSHNVRFSSHRPARRGAPPRGARGLPRRRRPSVAGPAEYVIPSLSYNPSATLRLGPPSAAPGVTRRRRRGVRRCPVPVGTPFHPRTFALCESLNYRDWSGYYTVSAYEAHHEHEYNAIRNAPALIDVSPLFKYVISGRDASALVNRVITRDVARMAVGQVFYTPWCDEHAHVIDDGTVSRLGEQRF